MGASKELFLRMSQEYYMEIPEQLRECYLRDKIYRETLQDYEELIKDPIYKALIDSKKKANKDLELRKDALRQLNK